MATTLAPQVLKPPWAKKQGLDQQGDEGDQDADSRAHQDRR